MAAAVHEAAGGAGAASAMLRWPLPGCRPDSLGDLFSARTLAELARVAGAAGGAVALDLGGHTLRATAGGRPVMLRLLEALVPPAGLRSLALRNGTLVLRPGMGLEIASNEPFAVSLEHVKLTRPALIGGSGSAGRWQAVNTSPMINFAGASLTARLVVCRVELSPAGPAGSSIRQAAVGGGAAPGRHAGWPGGMPGGGVAACRVAGRRWVGHAGRRSCRQSGPRAAACASAGWRGGVPGGGAARGAACRVAGWRAEWRGGMPGAP
jgi:hypothetical protein